MTTAIYNDVMEIIESELIASKSIWRRMKNSNED